jgi:hypothetical protein
MFAEERSGEVTVEVVVARRDGLFGDDDANGDEEERKEGIDRRGGYRRTDLNRIVQ